MIIDICLSINAKKNDILESFIILSRYNNMQQLYLKSFFACNLMEISFLSVSTNKMQFH